MELYKHAKRRNNRCYIQAPFVRIPCQRRNCDTYQRHIYPARFDNYVGKFWVCNASKELYRWEVPSHQHDLFNQLYRDYLTKIDKEVHGKH